MLRTALALECMDDITIEDGITSNEPFIKKEQVKYLH